MIFDLKELGNNGRLTRVIFGLPSSTDISSIFGITEPTKDFLSEEIITNENFDKDSIFYIRDLGYCFRESLIKEGFKTLNTESKYDILTLDNFKA